MAERPRWSAGRNGKARRGQGPGSGTDHNDAQARAYTHISQRRGVSQSTLSKEQYDGLKVRFPKDVELSLDNYLPGKVQADVYEVIPVGKPAFLWFTYIENGHAAFIVTKTQHGYRFDAARACFSDDMAFGTILSGIFTIRTNSNGYSHTFFCADDVLYHKGKRTGWMTMAQRLQLLSGVFANRDVGNLGSACDVLTVCTPVMTNDFTVAQGYLHSLPYPCYGIRMVKLSDTAHAGILAATNKDAAQHDAKRVFLVRANPDPDSYTLYGRDPCTSTGELKSVGLGLVPSYADSVRMNLLFRNIRENVSIDYIEESDDEDEFERIDQNKYLIEGAEHKMVCSFSKSFNKWVLESVARGESQISDVPSSQHSGRAWRNNPGANGAVRENNRRPNHPRPRVHNRDDTRNVKTRGPLFKVK